MVVNRLFFLKEPYALVPFELEPLALEPFELEPLALEVYVALENTRYNLTSCGISS